MSPSDEAEPLDFADAAGWEAWLAANHDSAGEAVLRIAKKGASRRSVTIAEALDVALCYGWIDSVRRRGDEHSYLQRYSPRRARSPWSAINSARAVELIADKRMRPPGQAAIDAAKADGRWAGP